MTLTSGQVPKTGRGGTCQDAAMSLDAWTRELARALDVDLDIDVPTLLDVARDAAHQVDRPAAPVTTFLVGYAAALRGGGWPAVQDAAAVAQRLAATWPGQPEPVAE